MRPVHRCFLNRGGCALASRYFGLAADSQMVSGAATHSKSQAPAKLAANTLSTGSGKNSPPTKLLRQAKGKVRFCGQAHALRLYTCMEGEGPTFPPGQIPELLMASPSVSTVTGAVVLRRVEFVAVEVKRSGHSSHKIQPRRHAKCPADRVLPRHFSIP